MCMYSCYRSWVHTISYISNCHRHLFWWLMSGIQSGITDVSTSRAVSRLHLRGSDPDYIHTPLPACVTPTLHRPPLCLSYFVCMAFSFSIFFTFFIIYLFVCLFLLFHVFFCFCSARILVSFDIITVLYLICFLTWLFFLSFLFS